MKKGLVHVYTGNGKGKTTAALGLCLRACGQGKRICVFQFLKAGGPASGEMKSAGKLGENFRIVRFPEKYPRPGVSGKEKGTAGGGRKLREALRRRLGADLDAAEKEMLRNRFDVIVLDEILPALTAGFVDSARIVRFVRRKPEGVELVLTGRGKVPAELRDRADYFTRMQEVRHPFTRGVKDRPGVEY